MKDTLTEKYQFFIKMKNKFNDNVEMRESLVQKYKKVLALKSGIDAVKSEEEFNALKE